MNTPLLFRNPRIAVCLLTSLAALGSPESGAQDWPQWRGSQRDARASAFQAPESWPKELTRKWKVTVGEGVATPSLVGDRLYVFSRQDGGEVVRCLSAADGRTVWTVLFPGQPAPGAGGPPRAAIDPGDPSFVGGLSRPVLAQAAPGGAGRPEGAGGLPRGPGGGRRGGGGMGGGGYGNLVDIGAAMLALTPAGQLLVFEGSPAFRVRASYKVAEGKTHAYPVASGNRLFIKDEDSVTLWAVE